jgi:hypothetical protein
MAALSPAVRLAIRSAYGDLLSRRRDPFVITKAQLDAAINACDDWIDANAASFNTALPVAARTGLTAAQKAELFSLVALRRFSG